MNIPNNNKSFSVPEHAIISDAISHYAFLRLKVQDWGRVMQVCTGWNKAFTKEAIYQTLSDFQPLFTPMVERFIHGAQEIDTSPSPKFLDDLPINQAAYESLFVDIITQNSIDGYGFFKNPSFSHLSFCFLPNFKEMSSTDRDRLLNAAATLSNDYYHYGPVVKRNTLYNETYNNLNLPQAECKFSNLTIKELLDKITKIKENPDLLNAFEIFKNIIIEYNFLPINPRNPILQVSKVPSTGGRKLTFLLPVVLFFISIITFLPVLARLLR